MKNSLIPNLRCTLVAGMVISVASAAAYANNLTPIRIADDAVTQLPQSGVIIDKFSSRAQQPMAEDNYYIVQLQHEPVATYAGGVPGYAATKLSGDMRTRDAVNSSAAQSYRQFLQAEQAAFVSNLQQAIPSAQVVSSAQGVMNAVVIELPYSAKSLHEIAALPNVKGVFKNERVYPAMDVSNSLINSEAAWNMAGGRAVAGEGVRIAVVDSGILSDHPMFAANGHTRPNDLRDNDYCATTDPTFCNDKLIIARSYPPADLSNLSPQEVSTPYDIDGHGSHVAGTAAGNLVSTTFNSVALSFSGVAPGAHVMAYKALFLGNDSRTTGFTSALINALEDAYHDGADVINNSWGGGSGNNPASSAYRPLMEALEDLGVMVVNAAGNSGPGERTIICPACIESGIAVANTQTGRTFGAPVTASGVDVIGLQGNGDFTIEQPISGPFAPLAELLEGNQLACESFESSIVFANHIIMVDRGECTFEIKANNLAAAGAVGMLLANNTAGIISMDMANATLPSVSITQGDAATIADAWRQGDTATINAAQQIITHENIDIMAASSSRGPNGDSSILKPEIAAPGTNILSAYPTNTTYGAISGTSMASPHVAGAAAVLRQLRPALDAKQMKSVLITSSNPAVRMQNATDQATPFDMGAGRLDIEAALGTAIALDKPSMAAANCAPVCSFTRTVTNLMAETTDWNVDFIPFDNNLDVRVNVNQVTLAGGESVTLDIDIDTTYALEGWQFGHLEFTDVSGNYARSLVPFAVHAVKSDSPDLVSTGVTSGAVVSGESVFIESRVNRENMDGEVKITVDLPENVALVANSIAVNEVNAQRSSFSIASDQRSFTWVGELNEGTGSTSLNNSSLPTVSGTSLSGMSIFDILESPPQTIDCSSVCDEQIINLGVSSVGAFTWDNVAYEQIQLSPNGYLTPGSQTHSGSWVPQEMPDTTPPNNVLAPLWADFVVGGSYGGDIAFTAVTLSGDSWLIVEWHDVRVCEDNDSAGNCIGSDEQYSFAIWHNMSTDETFFNYIDIPSVMPSQYSVGFENISGTLGFNFTGSLTDGQVLKPVMTPADSFVVLTYQGTAGLMGIAAELSAESTPNTPVTIAFGENFTATSHQSVNNVTVANAGVEYTAFAPVVVEVGDVLSASVVAQADAGTAAITDGKLTFTPAAARSGEFTFSYRIEDDAGRFTLPGDVTVTVVNSAPAAAASASESSVAAGRSVNLSAAGSSDPDGDPLSYNWRQTGGPTAEMSNITSATASFIAPKSGTATTLTFQVTVSDGELSDTATVSVQLERYSSKKWYQGSFGALIILLGLPLVWVRRRTMHASKASHGGTL